MLVKLEWLGYRMVKKLWRYVKPFSSDTGTLRMDGRTDRQTDIFAISISRVSVLTHDKWQWHQYQMCNHHTRTHSTWLRTVSSWWTRSSLSYAGKCRTSIPSSVVPTRCLAICSRNSCIHTHAYVTAVHIYRVVQKKVDNHAICEHNLHKLLLNSGFVLEECRCQRYDPEMIKN